MDSCSLSPAPFDKLRTGGTGYAGMTNGEIAAAPCFLAKARTGPRNDSNNI